MTRQIRLLTKLSLYNFFGLNEFRFTKDSKKKTRYYLFALLWLLLLAMMGGYICALSYGLIYMDMGNLVPAVLVMCVSLVSFLFTMIKAEPVLFHKSSYESLIALPVTIRSIIVSRFLSMYFTNLLLGMLVMLPGMAVYGILQHPGLTFYLYGVLSVLFLPLLPLTLASMLGALIAGISSRWRRKNLVAILLTLLLVSAIMAGSLLMGQLEEEQLVTALQEIALMLETRVGRSYPPALWVADAMVQGNAGAMFLFLGVSIGAFLLFLEALRPFYGKICSLLSAREAKGNYRMAQLKANSVLKSLTERELRRYFSSTVYVTNTLMGPLLMLLMAAAILFMGVEPVESMLGMSGIVGKTLPVFMGLLPAMLPMTACSISMEGKQWWMLQTLPITRTQMIWSKVGANLLVSLPFYLLSELLLFIALRPDPIDLAWLLIIPMAYILFSARTGLAINEKFPIFDWENEVRPVKQGAASLLTLLATSLSALAPMVVLIACPTVPAHAVYAATACLLLLGTWILDRIPHKSALRRSRSS